jgi:hypothetical protein
MEIPTCSALRIRREPNSHDFMNSRMWDNIHATPPTRVSSDVLAKNTNDPRFMDMNPIGTRRATGTFRAQLEYMPTNQLPPEENSTNPYLQRLDAEGREARNVAREFRSAVTEDNRERDIAASKRITDRQFQDRWLPPQTGGADISSLEAYELLRPKQYSEGSASLNGGTLAPTTPFTAGNMTAENQDWGRANADTNKWKGTYGSPQSA